jgi:hypothetical protein
MSGESPFSSSPFRSSGSGGENKPYSFDNSASSSPGLNVPSNHPRQPSVIGKGVVSAVGTPLRGPLATTPLEQMIFPTGYALNRNNNLPDSFVLASMV